jgi:virginiamycin B lyase
MKKIFIVISAGLAAVLMIVVVAAANGFSAQETDLTAYGEVYEVNLGSDGMLYVSDYTASQLWRIDPDGSDADVFQFSEDVLDAKPAPSGDIWWTDGSTIFGRLDPDDPSPTALSWAVPSGHNLQGVAFDSSGNVWMSEWINYDSNVYSFKISSTELCTHTLTIDGSTPTSSQSFYILPDGDKFWIADRGHQRIFRLDPAQNQATWWQIPDSSARPVGIAIDNQGNFWWGDEGLGALARLDPQTDEMTRYDLPYTARPQVIALKDQDVWYTAAQKDQPGTYGVLFPGNASGTTSVLTSGTHAVIKSCSTLGAGEEVTVSVDTRSLSWSDVDVTKTMANSSWQVYQLPDLSIPYGLSIESESLWMTDQGRQKLIQSPIETQEYIYLPMLIKK